MISSFDITRCDIRIGIILNDSTRFTANHRYFNGLVGIFSELTIASPRYVTTLTYTLYCLISIIIK